MTEPIVIRPMDAADLPAAHALSQAVRWPHRLEDWRLVLGLGEGVVAEAGRAVVATALAWRFGARGGSTGMVIVSPDRQGQGIGGRLMAAILPALGDRSVVLHATEAGEPLYRRLGFVPAGDVRQHQGVARPLGPIAADPGERLRAAMAEDLAALASLDEAAMGMDRGVALRALLAVSEAVVLERGGAARGFALLRAFGRGRVIGPVVAPDAGGARLLAGHWIGRHGGDFLRMDVPAESGLPAWLASQGMAEVDAVTRMVRGPLPAPGAVRSFALASQALG